MRCAVAGARSDRGAVGEVATNRLGAERLDGCSRFVGASQGPHPRAARGQSLDQSAADEAGATGHEGARRDVDHDRPA